VIAGGWLAEAKRAAAVTGMRDEIVMRLRLRLLELRIQAHLPLSGIEGKA